MYSFYFTSHICGEVTDGEQTCSLRRGVGGSSFSITSCCVTKSKTKRDVKLSPDMQTELRHFYEIKIRFTDVV